MPTVYAVHGNYASRAAQTGRRPERATFFIKPSSTLVPGGGPLTLPAGVSEVSFEAELVLVVGRRASGLQPGQGWAAIDALTVANDLGAPQRLDLDPGSNVRYKGAAGFTPYQPEALAIDAVDGVHGIRVRAWLNDELVQDEDADDMLVSADQLVCELSAGVVLEPGDLILTGTPAGAGQARAGDRIEVRIDLPDGRSAAVQTLITPPVGPHSGGGDLRPDRLAALHRRLAQIPTASLDTALHRLGLPSGTPLGVHPLAPIGTRMVGAARTVRLIPYRPDLAERVIAPGPHRRTFQSINPGEVVVIEARGVLATGTVGDLLAGLAAERGAAGVVTDGAARDSTAVVATDLPVFAAGRHPAALGRVHLAWEAGGVISCGGVAVAPGDTMVGDDDGVVVIPHPVVEQVLELGEQIEREDAQKGHR